jgi:hypothetical protein
MEIALFILVLPNNSRDPPTMMHRNTASKHVSFSTEVTVIKFKTPYAETANNFVFSCNHHSKTAQPDAVKDGQLPSRERRIQQMIARKALLSYQRNLHRSNKHQDSPRFIAETSQKFSLRAKDRAIELARLNFIEVYKEDAERPRFSLEMELNVDVPIKLSEFPSVKISRKVSFDDEKISSSKRRRIKG